MEYLGIALFAVALLGGAWWLGRRMTRGKRNEGSEHGGGLEGYPRDAPYP
jgi:hypothetical protein